MHVRVESHSGGLYNYLILIVKTSSGSVRLNYLKNGLFWLTYGSSSIQQLY